MNIKLLTIFRFRERLLSVSLVECFISSKVIEETGTLFVDDGAVDPRTVCYFLLGFVFRLLFLGVWFYPLSLIKDFWCQYCPCGSCVPCGSCLVSLCPSSICCCVEILTSLIDHYASSQHGLSSLIVDDHNWKRRLKSGCC